MPTVPGHTLSKKERLSGKMTVSHLMARGRYGNASCLRYCVLPGNGLPYSRLLVSVPKRYFKRAVKRNLLKRRIRESYRLQKEMLGPGFDLMLVYTAREVLSSAVIREAVGMALNACGRGE